MSSREYIVCHAPANPNNHECFPTCIYKCLYFFCQCLLVLALVTNDQNYQQNTFFAFSCFGQKSQLFVLLKISKAENFNFPKFSSTARNKPPNIILHFINNCNCGITISLFDFQQNLQHFGFR